MKFRSVALLAALLLVPLSAGAETFPQERTPKTTSFNPPITPALTGSPGPNVNLRTMGSGPPIWAPIPAASAISYSPATPGNWPLIPTEIATALDSLAATLNAVSATASGRAAILNYAVGNGVSISTNNYLGAINDQSATPTNVSPIVIPCTGSLVGIRAQRAVNSTTTSVQQFFKSSGGAVVNYVGTGVSCSIPVGSKDCSAATVVPVTTGDMLIVRVTGNAWSTGAGAISTKILCS